MISRLYGSCTNPDVSLLIQDFFRKFLEQISERPNLQSGNVCLEKLRCAFLHCQVVVVVVVAVAVVVRHLKNKRRTSWLFVVGVANSNVVVSSKAETCIVDKYYLLPRNVTQCRMVLTNCRKLGDSNSVYNPMYRFPKGFIEKGLCIHPFKKFKQGPASGNPKLYSRGGQLFWLLGPHQRQVRYPRASTCSIRRLSPMD